MESRFYPGWADDSSYPLPEPSALNHGSRLPYFVGSQQEDSNNQLETPQNSASLENDVEAENLKAFLENDEELVHGAPYGEFNFAEFDANQPAVDPDFSPSSEGLSDDSSESHDSDEEGGMPHDDGFTAAESLAMMTATQEATRGRGRGRGRPRGSRAGRGRVKNSNSSTRGRGKARGGPRGGWKGLIPKTAEESIRSKTKRAKGIKKGKSGPHAPAEPSEAFKEFFGRAREAFLARRLDEALNFGKLAVQENPEIFSAHSLLSQIYLELGQEDESLGVLWSGGHTKRDAAVWWEIANRTSEVANIKGRSFDEQLLYCYSQITKIDQSDLDARQAKLEIFFRLQRYGSAMFTCLAILRKRPNDLEVLETLAELSILAKEPRKAIDAYREALNAFQKLGPGGSAGGFTMDDLDVYLELFIHAGEPRAGLNTAKTIARWLCGRSTEDFWDTTVDDDREWDIYDAPRRQALAKFQPNTFNKQTYGLAIPASTRSKMGIFRLQMGVSHFKEAMHHFSFFDPGILSENPVRDLSNILLQIAEALYQCRHYKEAIRFYDRLASAYSLRSLAAWENKAQAHIECSELHLAVECFKHVLAKEPENSKILLRTATLYDSLGENLLAREYIARAKKVELQPEQPTKQREWRKPRRSHRTRGKQDPIVLQATLSDLRELEGAQRAGDPEAIVGWMDCAKFLMLEFSCTNMFFPLDGVYPFFGYAPAARNAARRSVGIKSANADLTAADRLELLMHGELDNASADWPYPQPHDFNGITFDEWLDMWCEYAFCCARLGDSIDCYNTLDTATRCNIFFFNEKYITQVYNTRAACAIKLNDERELIRVSRWFFKAFPTSSDSFRLFGLLIRALHAEHPGYNPAEKTGWYRAGPTQKFILRSLRGVDYHLLTSPEDRKYLNTNKESAGTSVQPWLWRGIMAKDRQEAARIDKHDSVLITLYGHICTVQGTYKSAFNYYFRSMALQPKSGVLQLSMALSYIQEGMVRMAQNRHYSILQAVASFDRYRRIRLEEIDELERKYRDTVEHQKLEKLRTRRRLEAAFNEGRMWHSLNLKHLAVRAYQQCLHVSEDNQHAQDDAISHSTTNVQEGIDELFVDEEEPGFHLEAAYALQNIYAIGGDIHAARAVGEQWMVL